MSDGIAKGDESFSDSSVSCKIDESFWKQPDFLHQCRKQFLQFCKSSTTCKLLFHIGASTKWKPHYKHHAIFETDKQIVENANRLILKLFDETTLTKTDIDHLCTFREDTVTDFLLKDKHALVDSTVGDLIVNPNTMVYHQRSGCSKEDGSVDHHFGCRTILATEHIYTHTITKTGEKVQTEVGCIQLFSDTKIPHTKIKNLTIVTGTEYFSGRGFEPGTAFWRIRLNKHWFGDNIAAIYLDSDTVLCRKSVTLECIAKPDPEIVEQVITELVALLCLLITPTTPTTC